MLYLNASGFASSRFGALVAIAAIALIARPGGAVPPVSPAAPAQPLPQPRFATGENPPPEACHGDIRLRGVLADVLSNALSRDFGIEVYAPALSEGSDTRGEILFQKVVAEYGLDPAKLKESIRRHRHTNCKHQPVDDSLTDAVLASWEALPGQPTKRPSAAGDGVSAFARDVTLHVALHELGHALIREFDIPVLGNEETVADAFATYYLTTYLPDRAPGVLAARVTSLMIEASESAEIDWTGEHDHDARRACQIAALAVAADPAKYREVAAIVGMSDSDIGNAVDYGGEVRRSWRRVLAPLWMPDGQESGEARVRYDDGSTFLRDLCAGGLAGEIEAAMRRFDWHSQVTVQFVEGDGRAGWNRSARTVTVHSAYVQRFISQGQRGLKSAPD